jgi:Cft2 family RNA processing exonuclease
MSDPIPKDGGTEAGVPEESLSDRLPPKDLPEELVRRRLGRLDTRRALAELCKNVPGLEEVLLPRGIQADALTRKSGARTPLVRGIARKVTQDAVAWGAFRTAVQDQIPPETFDALEDLSPENLEELFKAHTTEGLLLAALSAEEEPKEEVVETLIGAWREEHQQATKRASEDAHVRELETELERLKQENEQLSFASRAAKERAAALAEEVDVLTGEREDASTQVRRAEERATSALDARSQLDERITELEQRGGQLERALESERTAYSRAAERVEELHDELGRVVAERDRIQDALRNARFTDKGFGELLVRAVKNEVGTLPNTLDSTARTARLLEFMSKVLAAHADLREGRTPGSGTAGEEGEDPDPSLAAPAEGPAEGNGTPLRVEAYARPRPTLSFRALGGAGEVGGSSHLLDFGTTRVLVDAGIKPDGRGPAAPNFGRLGGLDAAVVTHAHLDHCGALPLLVRDRPEVPIYCTPPSAKLIVSALNDHAAMGGGLAGGAPIQEVEKRLVPVPFGKPVTVGDAEITLTESGHILGAASVLLTSGPATVFHTGDICMEDHFSIPSARLPEVRDIDLLIMEATLADQKPQPFSESIKKMVEVINDTVLRSEGTVLIPTYALGQAQEIILGLKHYGQEYGLDRDVFIYVDGSVVTTSERLYAEQLGYMKPYLQHTDPREIFFSENIRAVSNDDKARERILSNPCAVIASPVTMQGGASAFYRKRLETSARNAVILPSNAASSYGTHRAAGEEEQWRVERVSFAAHCTQDELLGITEKLSPHQIILIHGSKRRISDLAFRLAPNYKIHTPAVGETVRTVL